MSAPTMDVFSLREAVVGEYKKFATSFTTIQAEDIRKQVEAIYAKEPVLARWLAQARSIGLPRFDPEPLFVDGTALPLVWRSHYLAAAFDGLPAAVMSQLEDKGFEVVVFGNTDSNWAESFARLSAALGRTS